LVKGKELYDMETDPGERQDVAAQNPAIVSKLKKEYEDWFREMAQSRGFVLPRIYIGTRYENPVVLSRIDWRGPNAGFEPGSHGYWELMTAAPGDYEFSVMYGPQQADRVIRVRFNGAAMEAAAPKGSSACLVGRVRLPAGAGRLEADIEADGTIAGPYFVVVRLL
jgi:hypothetical protein